MMTERKIAGQEHDILYFLERKPVKNINLRIRRDGSIYVSANPQIPAREIDAFVASKEKYIIRTQERFRKFAEYSPQPKRYISGENFILLGKALRLKVKMYAREEVFSDGVYLFLRVRNPFDFRRKEILVTRFLDQQCRDVFSQVIARIYPIFEKYGVPFPLVRIRTMTSRWGSCMPGKRIITLNTHLLKAPLDCIEYVVMHEFCHFIHPNHSKRFYTLLAALMPDWRERKRILEESASF